MKKLTTFIIILFCYFQVCCSQVNVEELFNEGQTLLEKYKFVKAEQIYSSILEKTENPDQLKKAYIYRGFAYNGQGKFDKAIQDFDKVITLDPKHLEAYLNKAKTYAYKSEYTPAIKTFEKVVSLSSNAEESKVAYYYLGNIYVSRFETKKAIKYLDKLAELSPNNPEVYFLRASAKNTAFDFEGAVRDYNIALKLKPDYQAAYAGRGVAKVKLVPTSEKNIRTCLEEPCKDLLKAQKMGDNSLEEVILLHCQECQ